MTPERQNEIWAMLTAGEREDICRWRDEDSGCYDFDEGYNTALEAIFGSHNLTSQAEEKPKEPRFKVGDKVLYNDKELVILNLNQVECNYRYYVSDNIAKAYWYDEDELTPYTKPKEDVETSEDNGQNPLIANFSFEIFALSHFLSSP